MRKRCKRYSTNDISMTKEEILLIISIFTFLTVVLLEIVGKIVWAIYMFKGLDFPDYFVKTLDILEIVDVCKVGLVTFNVLHFLFFDSYRICVGIGN